MRLTFMLWPHGAVQYMDTSTFFSWLLLSVDSICIHEGFMLFSADCDKSYDSRGRDLGINWMMSWWQYMHNYDGNVVWKSLIKYHIHTIQTSRLLSLRQVLKWQQRSFNVSKWYRGEWSRSVHPFYFWYTAGLSRLIMGSCPSHHAVGPPNRDTSLFWTHDCHLMPALSIRCSISPSCPTGLTTAPSEIGIP